MRMAFHQPNYIPNLGFFYKMREVDLFVVTTNVQFVRREWHSRAKLQGPGGDQMLTVPVSGPSRQMIREAMINPSERKWQRKHKRTFEMLYGKHADPALMKEFLALYDEPADRLVDINARFIRKMTELLEIDTEVVIDEEVTGHRQELLINICEKYGVRRYLSGLGGKNYMDDEYVGAIRARGITHEFVNRNVTGSYPYASLHYVLREGPDRAREIVRARPVADLHPVPEETPEPAAPLSAISRVRQGVAARVREGAAGVAAVATDWGALLPILA